MASEKTPQVVIEIAKTTRDKGSATNGVSRHDTESMQALYPNSPIHANRIDNASQKKILQDILDDEALEGGGIKANMQFGDAPDLSTVETGGGGLPASPFVPNPTSSPTGNAVDQPKAPDNYGSEPTSQGYGDGPTADAADRNPSVTSGKVARVAGTIGELVMKKGS